MSEGRSLGLSEVGWVRSRKRTYVGCGAVSLLVEESDFDTKE